MDGTRVTPVDIGVFARPEQRDSLLGLETAKYLTLGLFALMLYEYVITLDDEVKHFWKGPFKITNYLFFFNRYFSPLIVMMQILALFMLNPSLDFCRISIPILFLLTLLSISIIQAILITRVWFLYPGATILRFIVVFTFVICKTIALAFLYISANQLEFIYIVGSNDVVGCRISRPPDFWRVFVPNLVLHTIMYIATIYGTVSNPDYKEKRNLRKRLLKDGGVFYLIVFSSVTLTAVGSFLTDNPRINIPAIYCPIILSTTSIATSRLMFSLRAITHAIDERVNSNFEWLSVSEPKSGSEARTGKGQKPGSPSGTLSVSRCQTNTSPSQSRFSADSDLLALTPVSVSSRNRFIIQLGSIDEEKGLPSKGIEIQPIASARTGGKRDEAVPRGGQEKPRTLLNFPVPALLRKAKPGWI